MNHRDPFPLLYISSSGPDFREVSMLDGKHLDIKLLSDKHCRECGNIWWKSSSLEKSYPNAAENYF